MDAVNLIGSRVDRLIQLKVQNHVTDRVV
jgi:hypothetical protein